MPHIRVRSLDQKKLVSISKELIDQMEALIKCPRDYFTLEYVHSTFIMDGVEGAGGYPHVEVLWFDRGESVKLQVAEAITKLVKTVVDDDVCVYFVDMDKASYFENGQHY
ncbi:MAG: DUF1904 domain-containing protein [Clostridia bacterium]|nr:DUF1904 domain-containing protein [Clostridia bacterium]